MENKSTEIWFGGRVHENWSHDGLTVSYEGRTCVLAVPSPRGWLAAPCPSLRGGDVKADMAEYARSRELAFRLNEGRVPPLTAAYFRAAANAASTAACFPPKPLTPGDGAQRQVADGSAAALQLPELLRIALDERHMSWEDATAALARGFVAVPVTGETAPLAAVAALQPRTAALIGAVNEKLCAALWDRYPGDWERIASGAVLRDGEVDFRKLSAVLCGEIHCKKELRADALRTLYTVMPAKFKEL